MSRNLSPLPLTPFERYMLVDDRPAFPMNFFYRMAFRGRLDDEIVCAALQESLSRHPLLNATVERRIVGRWKWIPVKQTEISLPRVPAEPDDRFPTQPPLDFEVERGLRGFIIERPDGDDLLLQFHHCCCDGAGAFQFIQDVLVTYDRRIHGDPDETTDLQITPSRLRRRGSLGLDLWTFVKLIPKQLIGLKGARQFAMRRPVPVVPHELDVRDRPTPTVFPTGCWRHFSREETNAIRDAGLATTACNS